VRARGKSDSKTDGQTGRQTHRRIVQNHFSRRFESCTSQIRSYLVVDFLHDANTSIDMEVKLPEAIVPKVGHGPKMGQNGFDRACVSVVFLFLLCFIAHSFEANEGTDMDVLACFRPGVGGTRYPPEKCTPPVHHA